jgi:uroporphyrinogen III methyltransferase / synthase
VREIRSPGSVRGVPGNRHSYRDTQNCMPENLTELDVAIARLASFDWLILTSVNGVRFFFQRLAALGLDARALATCRLCAVGPKTVAAIAEHGLQTDLVAAEYKGEGVVAALREQNVTGKKILFPCADRARKVIPQGLSELGAQVVSPVAYRNVLPDALPTEAIDALEAGEVDLVTFTASSTVDNLAAMLGIERFTRLLNGVIIASIGPITSKTCRKFGLEVAIEPKEYTLAALTEEIVRFFASSPSQ